MQDRTLTLIQDDGKEILCDILFTYHSEEFNKDYVVFQVRGEASASAAIYHPEDNGKGSLERIESDEEWTAVKEVMKEVAKSEE